MPRRRPIWGGKHVSATAVLPINQPLVLILRVKWQCLVHINQHLLSIYQLCDERGQPRSCCPSKNVWEDMVYSKLQTRDTGKYGSHPPACGPVAYHKLARTQCTSWYATAPNAYLSHTIHSGNMHSTYPRILQRMLLCLLMQQLADSKYFLTEDLCSQAECYLTNVLDSFPLPLTLGHTSLIFTHPRPA